MLLESRCTCFLNLRDVLFRADGVEFKAWSFGFRAEGLGRFDSLTFRSLLLQGVQNRLDSDCQHDSSTFLDSEGIRLCGVNPKASASKTLKLQALTLNSEP